MRIAQRLYEGVDLGQIGTVGLITYMRTDSPRVSSEAIHQVRDWIKGRFGDPYLSPKPNVYKSRKSAQEAHDGNPAHVKPAPESQQAGEIAKLVTDSSDKIWIADMVDTLEFLQKGDLRNGVLSLRAALAANPGAELIDMGADLYESYVHPMTILSGLPSAGFGALVTLYLFHLQLNIYAFVGLIMLIGIVEKNAIMQIDFALEAERNQG
jgi:hypothetical protein